MIKTLRNILLLLGMPIAFTFAEVYTIEDILTRVKDCSDDIAIAEIEYAIGKRNADMTRAEALPQISFSTGIGYSGQALSSQMSMSSTDTAFTVLKHLHGATLNWSADISQPILTFGGAFNALKIAKISDTLFEYQKELIKEMYYISVVSLFDTVYIAQKDLEAANRSLAFAEKNLDKIKTSLALGNAVPRDTLTAAAKLYQEKSNFIKSKAMFEINLKKLAELTELSMEPETTRLSYDIEGWLSKIDRAVKLNNLEIQMKESEVSMRQLQISYERSKLLPSIYLVAGINNSFMVPNLERAKKDMEEGGVVFPQNAELSDFIISEIPEASDYFNADYINYNVGAQLTWNIFDGKRSISSLKKTKLEHEKSDRELKILREKSKNNENIAYEGYNAISEAVKSAQIGHEAALKAFESISEDMNEGFVDYLTFLEVEKSLDETEKAVALLQMQKLMLASQYRFITGESLVKDVK